jgi:uncharacterized protein
VRFWDTSAIVPLLLEQEASGAVRPLFEADAEMAAWWGTPVECASAIARVRREGLISVEDEARTLDLLGMLREAWLEILPSAEVREESMRLLRVHPLKAADALQLAAALVWAGSPRQGELVTLDERLALAARLEGLRVVPSQNFGGSGSGTPGLKCR